MSYTVRFGKSTKILRCPKCGKRFSSVFAKQLHERDPRLCPAKEAKDANDQ